MGERGEMGSQMQHYFSFCLHLHMEDNLRLNKDNLLVTV